MFLGMASPLSGVEHGGAHGRGGWRPRSCSPSPSGAACRGTTARPPTSTTCPRAGSRRPAASHGCRSGPSSPTPRPTSTGSPTGPRTARDRTVKATGIVRVPTAAPPTAGTAIGAWDHGTTGLAPQSRTLAAQRRLRIGLPARRRAGRHPRLHRARPQRRDARLAGRRVRGTGHRRPRAGHPLPAQRAPQRRLVGGRAQPGWARRPVLRRARRVLRPRARPAGASSPSPRAPSSTNRATSPAT